MPTVPPQLVTQHETIPVFGHDYTIYAVTDGLWNVPAVWDQVRAPTAQDSVLIPAGVTVQVDGAAMTRHVVIEGTLELLDSAHLTCVSIFGLPGSMFLGGQDGAPISATVTFLDTPLDPADTLQFGNGLITAGEWRMCGHPRTPFVRLDREYVSGEVLQNLPADWQPADALMIPDSRQWVFSGPRPVNSYKIERSWSMVPLVHDHPGACDAVGALRYLPHVANLTRSIVFRSENPNGVRGHVMVTDSGMAELCHVGFIGLGRTTVAQVGPGNQIGRYSLHFHHSHMASEVDGCVVADGKKWGLVLHDTDECVITGNVLADIDGAGLVTEAGTERDNVIDGNFAGVITGGGIKVVPRGGVRKTFNTDGTVASNAGDIAFEGSGFWLRRAGRNVFRNNVAANCRFAGFNDNGYYLPKVPDMESLEWSNNEAYACEMGQWSTYWGGGGPLHTYQHTIFYDRLRVWHCHKRGWEHYHVINVDVVDPVVLFDPAAVAAKPNKVKGYIVHGANLGEKANYETENYRVFRAEIFGADVGIVLPPTRMHRGIPKGCMILDGRIGCHVAFQQAPPTIKFSAPGRVCTLHGVEVIPLTLPKMGGLPAVSCTLFMDASGIPAGYPWASLQYTTLLDGVRVWFSVDQIKPCNTTRPDIVGGVVCP